MSAGDWRALEESGLKDSTVLRDLDKDVSQGFDYRQSVVEGYRHGRLAFEFHVRLRPGSGQEHGHDFRVVAQRPVLELGLDNQSRSAVRFEVDLGRFFAAEPDAGGKYKLVLVGVGERLQDGEVVLVSPRPDTVWLQML